MPKQKQPTALAVAQEAAILTVAVAIIAAAVYFFLVPSHASVSSISGLGIVLSNFVPLSLSAITMILNVVLLIIGFFTCGREFGAKTVYTSILLPVFIGLFERLFPDIGSLTDSQELDVLCYILVVSVPGYGRIVYLTYREPCVQGETGGILHYLTVCILIPHHPVIAYPASARLKLRLYEYDCLCSFAQAFIYSGHYQLN